MNQEKGYVSFVLHAHLPFIHHPESEDYLEEEWLYEAISETYIPLLTNFKKLEEEVKKQAEEIERLKAQLLEAQQENQKLKGGIFSMTCEPSRLLI